VLAHYTVRAGVPAEKAVLEAMRSEFQQRMTENRTPIGLALAANSALPLAADPTPPTGSKIWTFIQQIIVGRMSNGRRLGNVPLNVFMERLGSDHFGDKIVQATVATAAGALDAVLQDVAQKYENFGKDASEVFARRARVLSVLVAIVLAFWMHVDAFGLFQTFMRDPTVRNAVLEKQDEYLKKFAELQPPGTIAPANPPPPIAAVTAAVAAEAASASPPVTPGPQAPLGVRVRRADWVDPRAAANRQYGAHLLDVPYR